MRHLIGRKAKANMGFSLLKDAGDLRRSHDLPAFYFISWEKHVDIKYRGELRQPA